MAAPPLMSFRSRKLGTPARSGESKALQRTGKDDEQVGVAGRLARGGDQRVRLAAVVSLVVEEVRDQEAARLADLLLQGTAEPHHVVGEPRLGHAGGPCHDLGIALVAAWAAGVT